MQQIRQSQANLDSMLQKGGADPAATGKLLADIQALRSTMSKTHESFSAQAANTLTSDQKAKLKNLQDAMALMPVIHQASALGLIASPPGSSSEMRFRAGPRMHGPPPSN